MSWPCCSGPAFPPADGVEMLAADESDRAAAAALRGVADRLGAGMPFSEAFSQTSAFPGYMLDMLRVGEATGRLEAVLSSLSEYYDRRERITRTVRSAVLYPSVLAALMLAVAVILITQVLPIFGDISRQLGVEQSRAALALTEAGVFYRRQSDLAASGVCCACGDGGDHRRRAIQARTRRQKYRSRSLFLGDGYGYVKRA